MGFFWLLLAYALVLALLGSAEAFSAPNPVLAALSPKQQSQISDLEAMLSEWNTKINLVSRKDIANLHERHILPCLAVAKALEPSLLELGSAKVLDVGTGGGLPGLPLAICFPDTAFTLVDGRGKKILAVTDMAERLGLTNVEPLHVRAEELKRSGQYDYVLGRAVTSLPGFVGWVEGSLKRNADGFGTATEGTSIPAVLGDDDLVSGIFEPEAPAEDLNEVPPGALLGRGVIYIRGETTSEELTALGTNPSSVVRLGPILGQKPSSSSDLGYSSIFHFTTEALRERRPSPAAP
ncbi:unnamed protein product [Chrysoparadoxa australica]